MRALRIALTVVCLGACSTPSADKTPEDQMAEQPDARDEVRGVAEDAKGGAVIITEDGEVVYMGGLDAWPAELRGKQVIARGRLEKTDYLPDPVVSDDGAMSAGASGLETVLREPEWSLVPLAQSI